MGKPKYAGLKKDEIEVMDRFLAGKHLEGEYIYDVKLYLKEHLDTMPLSDLCLNEPVADKYTYIRRWMNDLSKRTYGGSDIQASRVDCVVETDKEIWILEVTPRLKKHAIGGCDLYPDLFNYQFKPTKPLRWGIVAGADDPRAHFTLRRLNTKLWIV